MFADLIKHMDDGHEFVQPPAELRDPQEHLQGGRQQGGGVRRAAQGVRGERRWTPSRIWCSRTASSTWRCPSCCRTSARATSGRRGALHLQRSAARREDQARFVNGPAVPQAQAPVVPRVREAQGGPFQLQPVHPHLRAGRGERRGPFSVTVCKPPRKDPRSTQYLENEQECTGASPSGARRCRRRFNRLSGGDSAQRRKLRRGTGQGDEARCR